MQSKQRVHNGLRRTLTPSPVAARQLIVGTASAGITALALNSNRRLLAVAEAALNDKECPVVNIYDASTFKRRKMLSWSEIGSTVVVKVAFSADGRLCLTQGGAPEWKLMLWTVEKVSCVLGLEKCF